jgi:hypothetical protein
MQMSEKEIEICRRFKSSVLIPRPEQKVGIALSTLTLKPSNALRHQPEGDTCGWYVWGGEELSRDSEFFQAVHVSHLPGYCSQSLPYLALAPGFRVLLAPGQEDVWYDDSLLNT